MVEVYEDLLVVGQGSFAPHVWQNKPSVGTITPRKFVIGILGNSSFKIFIICCKEESDYALEFRIPATRGFLFALKLFRLTRQRGVRISGCGTLSNNKLPQK